MPPPPSDAKPALAAPFRLSDVALTLLVSAGLFLFIGPAFLPLGVAGMALAQLVSFALPPALLAYRRANTGLGFGALGLRSVSAIALAGAFAIALGLWCWNAMWVAPISADWSSAQESAEWVKRIAVHERHLLVSVLAIALVPAVCEELLHRGLLLPALVKLLGAPVGVLASSLFFGLTHFSLARLLPTAVVGVILALVRLRTANLWPCMLLHGVYNAALLIVAEQDLPLPWWLPIPALGISGIGAYLVYNHLKLHDHLIRNE